MDFSILWYIPIFLLSLCFVAVVIPSIVRVANKIHLFDAQDGRKVHDGEISRLGGISFLPAILFTLLSVLAVMTRFLPQEFHVEYLPYTEIMMAAAGCVLLYLVGLMDDVIGVSYKSKFFLQIMSSVLICCSGLYVSDLHGILGIHELHPVIGVPLTIVIIVFIINAINLIDGIDGLASGLCIFAGTGFAIMFKRIGMSMNLALDMSLLGVMVMFYIYNTLGKRGVTKIFMGDTGSLTVGFLIAFFTIKLCCFETPSGIPSGSQLFVYGITMILVPVLDVFRVFYDRIKDGKNPFKPDKRHIHHKFLALGFSMRQTRWTIFAISAVFCFINIMLAFVFECNINIVIAVDIVVWILLNMAVSRSISVRKQNHDSVAERFEDLGNRRMF